ncbi:AAA family ATPase [Candidatus Micrarchaeota archaeon]|nr:AAA family ATPase [Candidatus Micrarchaeota archaeon]
MDKPSFVRLVTGIHAKREHGENTDQEESRMHEELKIAARNANIDILLVPVKFLKSFKPEIVREIRDLFLQAIQKLGDDDRLDDLQRLAQDKDITTSKEIREAIVTATEKMIFRRNMASQRVQENGAAAQGKTLRLKLPKLSGFDEVAEYARGLFEKASKIVIAQDRPLQELVINFVDYIIDPNQTPVLLVGPTGCGKTYSIRTLAGLIGIPFIEIVMPDMSPASYRGNNLETLLYTEISGKVSAIGGYPERMIIYIDEFDKLAFRGDESNGLSKQIQAQLLKLFERSAVVTSSTERGEIRKIKFEALAVLSGSFSFIESVRASNMISKDDLLDAGFICDLIGRIRLLAPFRKLDVSDLERILTSGACDVLARSTALCTAMGFSVELDKGAIVTLAQLAVEDDLGARSLNNYAENMFARVRRDAIFPSAEMPDDLREIKQKGKLLITADLVKKYVAGDLKAKKGRLQMGFAGK